ncbi:Deoxyribose-phosphate aldolase [Eumeta japonica]|uniref:deoxyribose-phosphate aldolase n=1 Tax=Eumeta variegata TaxID=151549 RepID=A0A4C1UJV1_EUMVA|nr:Deoxyribose-phosphate aldolase [Eumeta japonica]
MDFPYTNILKKVYINRHNIEQDVENVLKCNQIKSAENVSAWLLNAVKLIDLTTLSGDDTRSNVRRLCIKAANPLPLSIFKGLGFTPESNISPIHTAAVCVYPTRVKDAVETIKQMGLEHQLQVASVATGFPAGLYPLETRLQEIKYAVDQGATEIDIVIDRSLVLTGQWDKVYEEVMQMHKMCGEAHMKVILGVGELGTLSNVYKASMVSMFAGADFIKTSTGKEAVNATLPVGLVMCRAIKDYYNLTGRTVGLKPAGGIKSPQDAINWQILVSSELGKEWLTPKLFRFGASSLLDSIQQHLQEYVWQQE